MLLRDPDRFYTPKDRPSGHDISKGFAKDNGGAIPPNLLQFATSENNRCHLQLCKSFRVDPHPAHFPIALAEFFIKFLTDEGDRVLDIFGGSGTTGEAAERLGRRWRTIGIDRAFARSSVFRFVDDRTEEQVAALLRQIDTGESPRVLPRQPGLFDAVG
jgi:DNA modification methylase